MRRAVCAIVVVVLLVFAAVRLSMQLDGPRFNGRTLAHWTAATYSADASPAETRAAEEAFRACSNAPVPNLLQQLENPGTISLRGKMCARAAAWPLPARVRTWCQNVAYAETFTPAKAAYMLGVLGPAAETAVSPLLRACTNSNYGVRLNATAALGKIQRQPTQVVPVLITLLQKSDFKVPDNAAWALGQFGPEARPAIPALLKAQESGGTLGPEALIALRKIDPTARANARTTN